jgi:hypothetical protein
VGLMTSTIQLQPEYSKRGCTVTTFSIFCIFFRYFAYFPYHHHHHHHHLPHPHPHCRCYCPFFLIHFYVSSRSSIYIYGYGSIPINTIFSGMNIHLPAILMFTRGTRFWHTAIYIYILSLDLFGWSRCPDYGRRGHPWP